MRTNIHANSLFFLRFLGEISTALIYFFLWQNSIIWSLKYNYSEFLFLLRFRRRYCIDIFSSFYGRIHWPQFIHKGCFVTIESSRLLSKQYYGGQGSHRKHFLAWRCFQTCCGDPQKAFLSMAEFSNLCCLGQ